MMLLLICYPILPTPPLKAFRVIARTEKNMEVLANPPSRTLILNPAHISSRPPNEARPGLWAIPDAVPAWYRVGAHDMIRTHHLNIIWSVTHFFGACKSPANSLPSTYVVHDGSEVALRGRAGRKRVHYFLCSCTCGVHMAFQLSHKQLQSPGTSSTYSPLQSLGKSESMLGIPRPMPYKLSFHTDHPIRNIQRQSDITGTEYRLYKAVKSL